MFQTWISIFSIFHQIFNNFLRRKVCSGVKSRNWDVVSGGISNRLCFHATIYACHRNCWFRMAVDLLGNNMIVKTLFITIRNRKLRFLQIIFKTLLVLYPVLCHLFLNLFVKRQKLRIILLLDNVDFRLLGVNILSDSLRMRQE